MQDRILKIITDARAEAGEKFDSDGESVWVDDKTDGKTSFVIGVSECGQPDESVKMRNFKVELHVDLCETYEVSVENADEAENVIRERFENEEIPLKELQIASVKVNAEPMDAE